MTDCPLVFIQWEDSAQPIPGWKHLADFDPPPVVQCASVGWLIHDGPDMKAVAPNMGGLEDECNVQVSGVIRIPTRCIIQISFLDEPGLIFPEALSFHPATEQTRQGFLRPQSLDASCREECERQE